MKLLRSNSILFLICGISLSAILVTGCNLKDDTKSLSNIPTNSNSQPIVERQQLSGLPAKIQSIAEKITVRIDTENENGSGVIVARQGNIYYVLTAAHVVKTERPYEIVTPDGQKYALENSKIKQLTGADLAILQFQSDRKYEVATLGVYEPKWQEQFYQEKITTELNQNSQNLMPWVFLFGWQRKQNIPQVRLTAGRNPTVKFYRSESREIPFFRKGIKAQAKEKGYELSYSNFSFGGMSGGAVLDTEGRVIGIHLAAGGERRGLREVQFGMSLGTSIQKFLELAKKAGIESEWFEIETSPPEVISEEEITLITNSLFDLEAPGSNAKATDWVSYGNNLWRTSEYEQAIAAFDKAISLEPDFILAYFGKGSALQHQGNFNFKDSNFGKAVGDSPGKREALAVFNKINELDPSFEPAWFQKAMLLHEIGNSKLPTAEEMKNHSSHQDYMRYFDSIRNISEYTEAIKSLDKAIEINPENDNYYSMQTQINLLLQQYPEAVTSLSKAIDIEPKVMYYNQRSLLYQMTGDMEKAQADLNHIRQIEADHLMVKIRSE